MGAALLALAVIVAALGPALTSLPLDALRVAIGGLLLIFGLQWLRKAILRAAGLKAQHDETAVFAESRPSAARAAGARGAAFDGYAFAVAGKAVLLEGLEVVFIVLTFGASQQRVPLGGRGRGAGCARGDLGGGRGRAPLARVPENAMKFAVGVMLCSFGVFWSAEGAGATWPGGEAALLALIPTIALASIAIARTVRRDLGHGPASQQPGARAAATAGEQTGVGA